MSFDFWKNLKAVIPVIVGAATAMSTLKLNLTVGKIVAELTHNTDALKKAFQGLTIATQGATVAQEELNVAQSANVIGLVVTAVMSLISAFGTLAVITAQNATETDNANVKIKNYLENLENLQAEADKRIEDVQNESKVLKDLQKEYDDLRQKINPTIEDKSRLDTIAGQLANTLGISTQALKDKNDAYIDITGSVNEYIKKLEEQARLENATNGLKEAYIAYDKAKKSCQDYNKEVEKQQEIVNDNAKHIENIHKAIDELPIKTGLSPKYKELVEELGRAENQLEREKKSLESLKTYRANYQIQMQSAMQSEIEYKKALGQVVDEEKEWEQCGYDMNVIAEETNNTLSKLNNSETELSETTETATQKTETLSEKYERLNNLLEENEQAIKDVNDEVEQAMDSGDTAHIEELQSKLKDLNSENTTLKNRIKAVKDEIEKDANAIADAIENVENSMQMLQKAEKEVADNGKLSLNTLMSIQKKYPELIGLVNDYVSGVKTEKDVIAGLKEVYEKDADNYNQALAFKKLKQDSYNNEFASASAELVNKYKDHYGIDLKNFISVTEAKKAAQKGLYDEMKKQQAEYDRLFAQLNYKVIHNVNRGQAGYQEYEYFYFDLIKGWRKATDDEVKHFKDVQQAYFNSVDDYYDFDEEAFKRQLEEDLKKYYNPVSADSLLKLSNTDSSSNKNTAADKQKDTDKKQIDEYQEKLNIAKAAYDKLVNGKIEALQKEAQAAKNAADIEIAALDKVLAKRKQARADEERQKKIDFINAQLRYKQLDEFSRREFQRQKQDLLNEQSDINYENMIANKKSSINNRADLAQNKSQQAIESLKAAQNQFANHIAYLSGNQSYDQRVANNTTNQNIQIVQNGLNGDQVAAKVLKALGAV